MTYDKEQIEALIVKYHHTGNELLEAMKIGSMQMANPNCLLEAADALADQAARIAELEREIHALQKALTYWMPSVFDDRSAHDAYLLIGYEGDTESHCWGDEMVGALPRWTPASEILPAEPGWYLAMLAPDNDWGLMSDVPLQVEFDAYKSKPKAFTCFYDYRGDEDITEAVTHWMLLPAAPIAAPSKGEEK